MQIQNRKRKRYLNDRLNNETIIFQGYWSKALKVNDVGE